MTAMRRVVIDVEPAPDGAGWTVRATLPDSGQPLGDPYRMAGYRVDGRVLPMVPADRQATVDGPHTDLCAGDVAAGAALLERVRSRTTSGDDVAVYGRWLFECLLAPVWQKVQADSVVAAGRAVELALRWPVGQRDLHRLVWEAMRDTDDQVLAGHPHLTVAITRLVPGGARPAQPVRPVTRIPRVLFASGTRLADRSIRPGAMYMGLLQGMDAAGLCRARAVHGASIEDLTVACTGFGPDVVHLVAHGVLLDDGRGALMLRDGAGRAPETDATALISALSTGGRLPVAVLLSACNTASGGESGRPAGDTDPTEAAPLAAQLVHAGVPIVSAMSGEVTEPACRLYTRQLAEALHRGAPVVQASAHGRRAALMHSPAPAGDLDWALPALYLAEHLDPAQRLVDVGPAAHLAAVADSLNLRRQPVFIGHPDVLAAADEVIDDGAGALAILARESIRGLGGTRLLQEIGWRLLRDGQLPVFLGPYNDKQGPATARAVVTEILLQLVLITEKLALPPLLPQTPWADPRDDSYPARRDALAGLSPAMARTQIRRLLAELRDGTQPLDLAIVADFLADDLTALADCAAEHCGVPFGAHTRTVLLCDDVHHWGSPTSEPASFAGTGLGALLELTGSAGLGRPGRPMPVLFTGSRTEAAGPALTAWAQNLRAGHRVVPLQEFNPEEAVLGYQWVLLHPWTSRAATRPEYGHVYTAAPGKLETWEAVLLKMTGCRPVSVSGNLFELADAMVLAQLCRRDDDETAWRRYAEQHPEYSL